MEDNINLYIVEEIVDHIFEKGKVFYCVKWEGYNSEANTWEPESHFENCVHLIEEYCRLRGARPKIEAKQVPAAVRVAQLPISATVPAEKLWSSCIICCKNDKGEDVALVGPASHL